MRSYSKGTWFLIGFTTLVMFVLIDLIEVDIPAGTLSTDLMLGVTLLGYATIFTWLYRHRTPSKPVAQSRGYRMVGQVDGMTVYETYYEAISVEGKLGINPATQTRLESLYN